MPWSVGTMTSLELETSVRPIFYLNTINSGKVYQVAFCEDVSLDDVPLGPTVTVTYEDIVDGVMNSCSTPTLIGMAMLNERLDYEEEEEGGRHRHRRMLEGDLLTTPAEPRILVYIITLCGFSSPPATTPQVMSRAYCNVMDRTMIGDPKVYS